MWWAVGGGRAEVGLAQVRRLVSSALSMPIRFTDNPWNDSLRNIMSFHTAMIAPYVDGYNQYFEGFVNFWWV